MVAPTAAPSALRAGNVSVTGQPPSARPEVVVVGSVNRDYTCRVERLPAPGQTVIGGELAIGSGGKGGNQAVAASLLGARTAMVGRVGADDDGRALVSDLSRSGVDVGGVVTLDDVRTGAAFVLVDSAGENAIVVAPGANGRFDADDVRGSLRGVLVPPSVLVTQAEVPTATIVAAIRTADELDCRAVVNLAPYQPLPPDVLALCDPLVVNESEATELLGTGIGDVDAALRAVALLASRTRSAVLTLGADGAVVSADGATEHVPAPSAVVVDSTGAGDAFTGAIAAVLSRGADLSKAVRLGVRAGSFAVGRAGAQASYPTAADLGLDGAPA
jgi:ribokinase